MATKTVNLSQFKAANEQQRNEAQLRIAQSIEEAVRDSNEYKLTLDEYQKLTRRIVDAEKTIIPLRALQRELTDKMRSLINNARDKYQPDINNIVYRAKMEDISLAELYKLAEAFKPE